ncbi:MAG: IS110 family transposase [Pseudomonadota bacterium]
MGIDLAKNVFEVAVADRDWRVVERARLSRAQFERWFANRVVGQVVMEACGSAHHWGRWFEAQGIAPTLLPARYVRADVKRNKTDAADAAALLEASRASDIVPVRVKSVEQQALQALHRTRSLWMGTRSSRINALRCFCREFGLDIRQGSRIGIEQIGRVLADPRTAIPELLRSTMQELLEEIRLLQARIGQLERELAQLARQSAACTRLLTVPGIGLLTATAMVAATGGTVQHFRDARHFASWFGLTPKEPSSGSTRRIGRISKWGDRYLRMLLTHGARSVLRAATVADRAGRPLDALRYWALNIQGRTHHNKATCALANKLARICFAVLRDGADYGAARVKRKLARETYALPA